jgi:hypothetical protein
LLSFLCLPPVRLRTGNASAGDLVFKGIRQIGAKQNLAQFVSDPEE